MKTNNLLTAAALLCGISIAAPAMEYTQAQIYDAMCQKCHGASAEGNPMKKGPALNDRTEGELAVDIYELEGGGYQSSGSGHDNMEYNLGVIENKGMKVHANSMAAYIYQTFAAK